MRIIDVRDMPCPKPIIEARNAMRNTPPGEEIRVISNNATSCGNLMKYFSDQNVVAHLVEQDGDFHITVTNPGINDIIDETPISCPTSPQPFTLLVLSRDTMGNGNDDLGRLLIKAYLNTVADSSKLPNAIVCYNAGVLLATTDNPASEALIRLSDKGVPLWLCGTCVDFFGVKQNLRAGEITNMLKIVELLDSADKLIQP